MASPIKNVPLMRRHKKGWKMAEKKMTQVEALEIAVAAVENEEAREVLAHMIETKRKPRAKRENKEAAAFREEILKTMAGIDGPRKAGEIAEIMEVKPQRVANNLRVLVEAGKVEKIEGEKAKDAATYVLA